MIQIYMYLLIYLVYYVEMYKILVLPLFGGLTMLHYRMFSVSRNWELVEVSSSENLKKL